MKITAVVVTYNRLELLKHGLECLRRQRRLSEIMVVNNGSTDGTGEWLEQLASSSSEDPAATPVLRVVHQENVGGSGGFHTGIRLAYEGSADWIWCMDDDVFPHDDCLDRLLEHVGEPEVGILAPRRLLGGKVFTHEFGYYDFTHPLASMHGGKLRFGDDARDEGGVVEIAGCDFEGPFISRKVVEKVGLPNKDLFIFCDDTEYCLRASLAGFRLYYVASALMDKHQFFAHDSWTTRNQKKKWKRYYQVRNATYLNHHYGRNWGVRFLRGFLGVVGYWVPAVLSMPFSRAWSPADLKMLWRAYQDGIHERLGKRG